MLSFEQCFHLPTEVLEGGFEVCESSGQINPTLILSRQLRNQRGELRAEPRDCVAVAFGEGVAGFPADRLTVRRADDVCEPPRGGVPGCFPCGAEPVRPVPT